MATDSRRSGGLRWSANRTIRTRILALAAVLGAATLVITATAAKGASDVGEYTADLGDARIRGVDWLLLDESDGSFEDQPEPKSASRSLVRLDPQVRYDVVHRLAHS